MKNTLLIDGNYFIFSRLFVLPRPKKIPGLPEQKFMESDDDKAMLMRKLSIDLASEIRKMRNFSEDIVFTMDAKSWRKDFFSESGYKENRKYSDTIDWSGVKEVTDDFLDLLRKNGISVDRVPGAEGDDLIFAWTMQLNSEGKNAIIWSGDKDLVQLVNYNRSTNSYTLWYDNTRSKMRVYPGFKKWIESNDNTNSVDIFDNNDMFQSVNYAKKELKEFTKKQAVEVKEVFCDEFALEKILTGDKSDNIASVITKPSKKGDKTFRFSSKKAQNVVNTFKKRHKRFSTVYLFDDEYKEEICKLVAREMKVTGKHREIKENLELNTNLILLHVNTIPEVIQETMFKQIKLDNNDVYPNFEQITDKDKFLKGTKYLDTNYKKGSKNKPSGGAIGLF